MSIVDYTTWVWYRTKLWSYSLIFWFIFVWPQRFTIFEHNAWPVQVAFCLALAAPNLWTAVLCLTSNFSTILWSNFLAMGFFCRLRLVRCHRNVVIEPFSFWYRCWFKNSIVLLSIIIFTCSSVYLLDIFQTYMFIQFTVT